MNINRIGKLPATQQNKEEVIGMRWKIYNLAFSVLGRTKYWKKLGQLLW